MSITQATESGSLYTLAEIAEIGSICRNAGRLHMDVLLSAECFGSSALGCSPADMSWKAGVDALSFGATKNGTLAVDVIVLFDKNCG